MENFEELDMADHIKNTTDEHWLPLNPNAHMRLNYKIDYDEIERQDSFIQFGQYTQEFLSNTNLVS